MRWYAAAFKQVSFDAPETTKRLTPWLITEAPDIEQAKIKVSRALESRIIWTSGPEEVSDDHGWVIDAEDHSTDVYVVIHRQDKVEIGEGPYKLVNPRRRRNPYTTASSDTFKDKIIYIVKYTWDDGSHDEWYIAILGVDRNHPLYGSDKGFPGRWFEYHTGHKLASRYWYFMKINRLKSLAEYDEDPNWKVTYQEALEDAKSLFQWAASYDRAQQNPRRRQHNPERQWELKVVKIDRQGDPLGTVMTQTFTHPWNSYDDIFTAMKHANQLVEHKVHWVTRVTEFEGRMPTSYPGLDAYASGYVYRPGDDGPMSIPAFYVSISLPSQHSNPRRRKR